MHFPGECRSHGVTPTPIRHHGLVDDVRVSPDGALERLESRWRHVGDLILVVAWLMLVAAIVFVPLGVVADTDCGTLFGHPSGDICEDRVRHRAFVAAAVIVVSLALMAVAIARRRRRNKVEN
jgi:hypothetical protein